MKQDIPYSKLSETEKNKVDRFVHLSSKNGIQVGISLDQNSVVLVNPNGEIEASMPITDFTE